MNIGTWNSILTLIFITLKLMNYINWSWLWVLSPMWISLLIAFILFVVGMILKAYAKL